MVAEALGAAVLTVSVDDTQLRAGLQAVEQLIQRSVGNSQTAFTGLANAMRQPAGALGQFPASAAAASRGLDEFGKQSDRAAAAGQRVGAAVTTLGASLRNLAGLAGIVGIGVLAQQFIQTGKQSQGAEIQLKALTAAYGETQRATEATARVQKVLGISSLEASRGFSQLYEALRGTGINLPQLEVLFVGINKAAGLSGVGAAEANAAFLQLRQGLSSGRLQGDELRSVLEQLPALSQAIAKELGVSVGRLRQLGSEGKITTQVVFRAIQGIAGAAAPGRTSIEDIGIAFQNLQVTAAQALGPALKDLLLGAAAGLTALQRFVENNSEKLKFLGLTIVGVAKTLAPLALGILTVRTAMQAWAIATNAVRLAQAGLLALSGPKGWAILIGAVAATAIAAQTLETSFKGVQDAVKAAGGEAQAAYDQFKTLLGQTKAPGGDGGTPAASAALQANKRVALENYRLEEGLSNARIAAAGDLAKLEGAALQKVQARLAIQERQVALQKVQNALSREESKKAGTGAGENGTRNDGKIQELLIERASAIDALNLAIVEGRTSISKATKEDAQTIRETWRQTADSYRDAFRQTQDAVLNLSDPRNATQKLVLDQRRGIEDAATTAIRAADALARAQAEGRSGPGLTKLVADADLAGKRLELAGDRVGAVLKKNAEDAGKSLRDAMASRDSSLRGNFELLTPGLQQEQIRRAREEVQASVNAGVLRPGIQIGSAQQLFSVAAAANQIKQADAQVQLAANLKTSADAAAANATAIVKEAEARVKLQEAMNNLAAKNWQVSVNVNGQGVGTVNGNAELAYR